MTCQVMIHVYYLVLFSPIPFKLVRWRKERTFLAKLLLVFEFPARADQVGTKFSLYPPTAAINFKFEFWAFKFTSFVMYPKFGIKVVRFNDINEKFPFTKGLSFTPMEMIYSTLRINAQEAIDNVGANRRIYLTSVNLGVPVAHHFFWKAIDYVAIIYYLMQKP